jgi:hypothetical protein
MPNVKPAVFHKQWGTYQNNPLVVEQGLTPREAKAIDDFGKGGGLVNGLLVRISESVSLCQAGGRLTEFNGPAFNRTIRPGRHPIEALKARNSQSKDFVQSPTRFSKKSNRCSV